MLEYVRKLGEVPSVENLDKVNHEISIVTDILLNYHFSLSKIKPDRNTGKLPETTQVKKILKQIQQEEALIAECKKISEKIRNALDTKK